MYEYKLSIPSSPFPVIVCHTQVHQVGYAYTALGRAMKVHTEKKSWQEAATACNKEGGELVVVDHPSVNAWLARQGTKNMWIGATDWVRTCCM